MATTFEIGEEEEEEVEFVQGATETFEIDPTTYLPAGS